MRIIIIVLVIFGLSSCGEKAIENKRPADQVRFVGFVKELRNTVNAAESNKALRSILLDKGVTDIKAYIKDSLALRFNAWQARVLEISDNSQNSAAADVKFGLAMDPADRNDRSGSKLIVLSCPVNPADEGLLKIMKQLKTGDQVVISGEFIEKKGFIDIDSYSRYKFSKNVFDNPEFKSKITKVEKL